jgi:hypothetical protein
MFHGLEEAMQVLRGRSVEPDRDVNVIEFEGPNRSRLVAQRVARIVMQGQVDDHFVAFRRDSRELLFVGLARRRQMDVDRPIVRDPGDGGNCRHGGLNEGS